jgi:hypothetical protein
MKDFKFTGENLTLDQTSINHNLRPALLKRPRTINVTYFYCPRMLTAIDDIPPGKEVILTALPASQSDKFVTVKYDAKEFKVFWDDLRA